MRVAQGRGGVVASVARRYRSSVLLSLPAILRCHCPQVFGHTREKLASIEFRPGPAGPSLCARADMGGAVVPYLLTWKENQRPKALDRVGVPQPWWQGPAGFRFLRFSRFYRICTRRMRSVEDRVLT